MIEIKNSVFDVQGASKKDPVYGITLAGKEDVLIEGCKFANKGYSSILNHCEGNVVVKDCEFDCAEVYNPIEGSQKVSNGNVVVEGCEFKNVPGNNYINFYQFGDKSEHLIKDCTFTPDMGTNIVRISNRTSSSADFKIEDCSYSYPVGGEPTEYTAFLICQDYTNKSGIKQDFTKCSLEFKNVKCNNEVLNSDSRVFYVYEDGKGIITGENDPVIKF